MKLLPVILIALLSFSAIAQNSILNPGFELMDDTLPQNWIVTDFGAGLASHVSNSGSNSMAVWNWYYYAKGWTVNGAVPSGSFIGGMWDYPKAGTPIDYKATRMTGYYLYDTTGNDGALDTAYVAVLFKRYDSLNQKMDTVAFGEAFLTSTGIQANMVPFEVVVTDLMPGVEPDSVAIFLQSSLNGFCDANSFGNCLYLYVDDLAFQTTTGTEDITGWFQSIKTYPNPATNRLTVESYTEATLHIYSLEGKLMLSEQVNEGRNDLNVSTLATGLYLLQFSRNGEVLQREKLVVE